MDWTKIAQNALYTAQNWIFKWSTSKGGISLKNNIGSKNSILPNSAMVWGDQDKLNDAKFSEKSR